MTTRRDPINRSGWTWDATPMFDVSYFFLRRTHGRGKETRQHKGDFMLELSFVADSEITEQISESRAEPDPSKFKVSPEDSDSYLRVGIVTPAIEDQSGRSWFQVWEDNDYPETDLVRTAWSDGSFAAVYQQMLLENLHDASAIAEAMASFKARAFDLLGLAG